MKISNLPAIVTAHGTESLALVRGGITKRTLLATVAAFLVPMLTGLAKGDPGGNVSDIGLFTAAANLSIPLGTDIVRTSGYLTRGMGTASYVAFDEGDGTANDAFVAAHPRAAFKSANARYFRLLPGSPIKVSMMGGIADGSKIGGTDNSAVINAADLYCAVVGADKLIFDGDYFIAAQIVHSENLTWMGDGATIWMGMTNTSPHKDQTAMVRSRIYEPYSNFYIDKPGGFVPVNIASKCRLDGDFRFRWIDVAETFAKANLPNTRMCTAYYCCHDMYVGPGVKFDCGWSDWTFTHYGDRIFWNFATTEGGENRPLYSDGFHSIGGDDGWLFSYHLTGGDDALSIATNFNQGNKGWTIRASVYSRLASGGKLAIGRLGSTAGYANPTTARIEDNDIELTWLALGPSRNSYFRIDCGAESYDNDQGKWLSRAEDADLIRNNRVRLFGFGRNDGLPVGDTGLPANLGGQAALSLTGGADNHIIADIRHASLWSVFLEGIGGGNTFEIHSPDAPNWTGAGGASFPALEGRPLKKFEKTGGITTATDIIRKCVGFKINGLVAGGTRGQFRLIDIDGDVTSDTLTLPKIPDGYPAVETIVSDTVDPQITRFIVRNFMHMTAAGGGTPRGFKGHAQYSEFYISNLLAPDPIRIVELVTAFKVFKATYHPRHFQTRQIASGSINSFGAGKIRVQSRNPGVGDTLSAVGNMVAGMDDILIADKPATEPINVTAVSPSRLLGSETAELILGKSGATYTDRSYRP